MLDHQRQHLGGSHPRRSISAAPDDTPPPIRFSVVRCPARMPEILELRRAAYLAAHKIADSASATDMLDRRDWRASIVIAESAGQIIGCLRLTPPRPGAILGQDALGESVAGLPLKSEYLECSRVCIHPEHQGNGLFWYLAAHMLITAKRLGKPYLVGGIDASLWRFWWRCGYRKIGVSYANTVFSHLEHEVGVLDVEAALAGHTIDPRLSAVLAAIEEERNAMLGSVRDARSPGTRPANADTASRISAMLTKVSGSVGRTP